MIRSTMSIGKQQTNMCDDTLGQRRQHAQEGSHGVSLHPNAQGNAVFVMCSICCCGDLHCKAKSRKFTNERELSCVASTTHLGPSGVLVAPTQTIKHKAGLASVSGRQGPPNVQLVPLKLGTSLPTTGNAGPLGLPWRR
jgi:hypothetical protein